MVKGLGTYKNHSQRWPKVVMMTHHDRNRVLGADQVGLPDAADATDHIGDSA
jgi:hypothetical protein